MFLSKLCLESSFHPCAKQNLTLTWWIYHTLLHDTRVDGQKCDLEHYDEPWGISISTVCPLHTCMYTVRPCSHYTRMGNLSEQCISGEEGR